MGIPIIAGLAMMLPELLGASALGTVEITGAGPARVAGSSIDFSPLGGGEGFFAVTATWEGFTAVPLLSAGVIADQTDSSATYGTLAVPIYPFIILPYPGGMLAFSLERVAAGVGEPCTVLPGEGGSCAPTELFPHTSLLLTQVTGGVSLEFDVSGTVFDLNDSSSATYYARFSGNTTGDSIDTISEVLFALQSGGPGFVDLTWTAVLTSTGVFPSEEVPEPGTAMLMGIGLVVLVGSARLRKGGSRTLFAGVLLRKVD